jgi:hypothetical protein
MSGSGIAKPSREQSLTRSQEQTKVVGEWLQRFAILEGRNRVIDEEMIAIFTDGLSDLEPREIQRGFKEYLRTGTRFPWPSEVREAGDLE